MLTHDNYLYRKLVLIRKSSHYNYLLVGMVSARIDNPVGQNVFPVKNLGHKYNKYFIVKVDSAIINDN